MVRYLRNFQHTEVLLVTHGSNSVVRSHSMCVPCGVVIARSKQSMRRRWYQGHRYCLSGPTPVTSTTACLRIIDLNCRRNSIQLHCLCPILCWNRWDHGLGWVSRRPGDGAGVVCLTWLLGLFLIGRERGTAAASCRPAQCWSLAASHRLDLSPHALRPPPCTLFQNPFRPPLKKIVSSLATGWQYLCRMETLFFGNFQKKKFCK